MKASKRYVPHGLKNAYGPRKNAGQYEFSSLEFLTCLDEMGRMWIIISVEMRRQTKVGRGMTICVVLSEDQILWRWENEPSQKEV